jgi:hypothetical protein
MDGREIAEKLRVLAQLYADAAWTYERAIMKIEQEEMRDELWLLQHEHVRHFEDLANRIRQLGERPPEYGYTGELSEDIRPITDDMGPDEVIRTLRENERRITERIVDVEQEMESTEITQELDGNLEDEQIYMNSLDDMIT